MDSSDPTASTAPATPAPSAAPLPAVLPTPVPEAPLPLAAGATIPGEDQAAAYWLEETLLAWPPSLLPHGVRPADLGRRADDPPVGFGLLCSPSGGIRLVHGVLEHGEHSIEVPLGLAGSLADLRPDLAAAYPQLSG